MSISLGLIVFTVFGLIPRSSASLGPVGDLYILNSDINPDGFVRSAVLAGGTFPGPIISGWKGDNFQINVVDKLQDDTMNMTTTVHWHGLYQNTTNWSDGVDMVTQCPIIPGQEFLYNFSVPSQAGTFWYHSHTGLQYCDGLSGPFIIYDSDDPYYYSYDVDNDSTIISLSDWYHVPASRVPLPAVADSILINGLGRQAGDTSSPLTVFNVTYGLRYRFRLISMSCDPYFNFTIDNHSMTIIEVDGQTTQALTGIDSIQIFAAQRYSFILEANQPVNNYWIRASPEPLFDLTSPPTGLAILHYWGAPNSDPQTNQTVPKYPLVETSLHPFSDPVPPGGNSTADLPLTLNFTFNDATHLFEVNGYPYSSPPIPVLLQILSGVVNPQDLLPMGSVYNVPKNATVEITMPGGVLGITHPLHLHGHSFSVVRSAGNVSYNYDNPVRRDTVNIGNKGDEVTIRFQADNVGPWILHCHIDFHLNLGFAVVLAEDINGTAAAVHPSSDQLCPAYSSLPPSAL